MRGLSAVEYPTPARIIASPFLASENLQQLDHPLDSVRQFLDPEPLVDAVDALALRGKNFDLEAFLWAVELLGDGEALPESFRDHELETEQK